MIKDRILVIDDQRSNIDVLCGLLEDEYDLSVAMDGSRGLELARKVIPDLVLLDITMPGMDGYEVCRRLKADPVCGDIAVIFLTALDQLEHEEKGLSLGVADYITKPFNPRLVKARIANQIARKHSQQYLRQLEKNTALSHTVSGMAHELNTPLGVILTASSFLDDQLAALTARFGETLSASAADKIEDLQKASSIILANTQRIAKITSCLQELAICGQDQKDSRFSLSELLKETIMLIHGEQPDSSGHIEFIGGEPNMLVGNRTSLQKVLTRLIFGLLSCNEPNAVPVCITLEASSTDDHSAIISLQTDRFDRDNEVIPHLFEPFYDSMRPKSGNSLDMFVAYTISTNIIGASLSANRSAPGGIRIDLRLGQA